MYVYIPFMRSDHMLETIYIYIYMYLYLSIYIYIYIPLLI